MNERIRELADSVMVSQPYRPGNDFIIFTQDEFDKLAKLIIDECMNCCDVVSAVEWIDPPTYELGVKACKVKIQTHFGVK